MAKYSRALTYLNPTLVPLARDVGRQVGVRVGNEVMAQASTFFRPSPPEAQSSESLPEWARPMARSFEQGVREGIDPTLKKVKLIVGLTLLGVLGVGVGLGVGAYWWFSRK